MPRHLLQPAGAEPDGERAVGARVEFLVGVEAVFARVGGDLRAEPPLHVHRLLLEHAEAAPGVGVEREVAAPLEHGIEDFDALQIGQHIIAEPVDALAQRDEIIAVAEQEAIGVEHHVRRLVAAAVAIDRAHLAAGEDGVAQLAHHAGVDPRPRAGPRDHGIGLEQCLDVRLVAPAGGVVLRRLEAEEQCIERFRQRQGRVLARQLRRGVERGDLGGGDIGQPPQRV